MKDTYNTEEISMLLKLSNSSVRRILKEMDMPKVLGKYELTKKQLKEVMNRNNENVIRYSKEIIYVHTIWEIRESKLNFMK